MGTYYDETKITLRVLDDVAAERGRQDRKWGRQDHSPANWQPIILEEYGEAMRALLEKDPAQYRKEMVEAAACFVAAIEAYDRGVWIETTGNRY